MIPRLIIIIPCYNEQEVLPITAPQFLAKINQLAAEGLISGDSRVMFVNDGSKDDTWNIIQRLADQDEHYIGIAQSRNRGHQNAVLAGLMEAKDMCDITIPDSWAIDQIFPIMPIQRLDEKPERSATLQDITCDSDGKIANFISTRNVAHYLPVHALKKTEPYYVAVFLVGAYQEILGDMHNLFGDTNAVHVSVNEKGYNIEQIIDGETVAEVLDYVQYNPKKLVRTLETWVTKSVKEGKISLEEGKEFLSNYRSGLYGYTYLE